MNLSNAIAQMITDMLEDKNEVEIQRNILAQNLGCVPSQINYVLSSRFTPERGYMVESRRGGGGCIRITRIRYDKNTLLMHVVNSIGSDIDEATARSHLMNLVCQELISKRDGAIMLAAISDNNFRGIPQNIRDVIRASIFKQMLLSIMQ
ncbi:MAG: CtsR family transcriptional regulator [Oscillospiraceae bacterium]|nr:CtsR family transcriptional regulator [Oscillospiraceae bacterium]MDD6146412.1 CtsR family transcriptional regulator [Oscillospiraceae bacterium]